MDHTDTQPRVDFFKEEPYNNHDSKIRLLALVDLHFQRTHRVFICWSGTKLKAPGGVNVVVDSDQYGKNVILVMIDRFQNTQSIECVTFSVAADRSSNFFLKL